MRDKERGSMSKLAQWAFETILGILSRLSLTEREAIVGELNERVERERMNKKGNAKLAARKKAIGKK